MNCEDRGEIMETDPLLFRRQFIMGPEKFQKYPKWNSLELPEGYTITAHPDLKMSMIKKGEYYIVLLGYILDPINAELSDEQILEKIYHKDLNFIELISQFDALAGRYVCVSNIGKVIRIFNDTIGFRQVYYCYDKKGKIWCSSQPVLLAERLGLQVDKLIEIDLHCSELFRNGGEYWYPGNMSLYKEIHHLLPNRYLDIVSQKEVRYWPCKPLEKISFDRCIEDVTTLLEQLFVSAQKRFNLQIAVSSGLDSRIILASSRKISCKVNYFTHTHHKLTVSGADIAIPSAMLKRLGLNHHIVVHSEDLDPDFERVFRMNVTTARLEKGINAFTMYNYFKKNGKESIVVHGNAGEITRCFYFLPPGAPLNGETLGALTSMSKSKVAVSQFERWLQESGNVSKFGIRELDLFYWEQRIANWAAMSYSEYDIAFESFTPFSCRRLISMMLSADVNLRKSPRFKLHQAIIKKLWPELLEFEINPPKNRNVFFRRKLKYTPVYSVYKSIRYLKYSKLFSKYKSSEI